MFRINICHQVAEPAFASIGTIPKVAPVTVMIKHHQPTITAKVLFLINTYCDGNFSG